MEDGADLASSCRFSAITFCLVAIAASSASVDVAGPLSMDFVADDASWMTWMNRSRMMPNMSRPTERAHSWTSDRAPGAIDASEMEKGKEMEEEY